MDRFSKYKKATLDWCNERRAEQGKDPLDELPKGRRSDPHTCPCGKATGLRVLTYFYSTPDDFSQPETPLPEDVTCFITSFDAGMYPELTEV